jgi:hypothetical protein
MRLDRYAVGALAASAAMLVSGGVAIAASGDGPRAARCEALLAKIAERRGVTPEELQATVRARVLAHIDAAEKAGRLSAERALQLRERVGAAKPCAPRLLKVSLAGRGMLGAAAEFLGLDRQELRAQLPGTSLAALAKSRGKNVADLVDAMVAPAKARFARAVASGRITQARSDAALARLEKAADLLAKHVFPKK